MNKNHETMSKVATNFFNQSVATTFLNSLKVSRDGLNLVDQLFVTLQQRYGGQLVLPEILGLRNGYTFLNRIYITLIAKF